MLTTLAVAALPGYATTFDAEALFTAQTFVTSHNSYSGNLDGVKGSIIQQLDAGVRGLELDIHYNGGDISVGHDNPGDAVYHSNGNPASNELKDWLQLLNDWSVKNKNHVPVSLTIDLKGSWDSDKLDVLETLFSGVLTTPQNDTLFPASCWQDEVRVGELTGKVLVIINHGVDKEYKQRVGSRCGSETSPLFFVYDRAGGPYVNRTADNAGADEIQALIADNKMVRVYRFDQEGEKYDDLPISFRASDKPFYSAYQEQSERLSTIPSLTMPRTQWRSAINYDYGKEPSIALNDNNTVVEVHRSQNNNNFYYRVGTVNPAETNIPFGPSIKYDAGVRPVIALNNLQQVVEIHKSANNHGLWLHTGTVDPLRNTIDWGPSRSLNDSGIYPSIAVNDQGMVMEVHQSQNNDNIWYRVGKAEFDAENISWWSSAKCLGCGSGNGVNPQVSLNNNNEFIIVWQLNDHIFSQTGSLDINTQQVNWQNSYQAEAGYNGAFAYDTGYRPSVGLMDNGQTIEVHQSQSNNSLWFRNGIRGMSTQVWQDSDSYSTGNEPRVSINNSGLSVEVHKSDDNNGLFYSLGRPDYTSSVIR